MSAKITRRQIGVLMAAASAVQSQTTVPQASSPETDAEAIRQRHRDAAAQLAKVKLLPGTDPAFVFRA